MRNLNYCRVTCMLSVKLRCFHCVSSFTARATCMVSINHWCYQCGTSITTKLLALYSSIMHNPITITAKLLNSIQQSSALSMHNPLTSKLQYSVNQILHSTCNHLITELLVRSPMLISVRNNDI